MSYISNGCNDCSSVDFGNNMMGGNMMGMGGGNMMGGMFETTNNGNQFTFQQQQMPQQQQMQQAPMQQALPQAVPNSFVTMMHEMDVHFCITHPKGYDLNPKITKDSTIIYNQEEALKDADFVYVKNWSSYEKYGKILSKDTNWMMTKEKLGNAKFMHCLPVRRNVIVADEVIDSENSIVIEQANNRTYAAQIVLKKISFFLRF